MAVNPVVQAGLLNQSSAQVIDSSLRFSDNSSQYLSRSFASGNRRTWTWSGWVKNDEYEGGRETYVFGQYSAGNDNGYTTLYWIQSGRFRVSGWSSLWAETKQLFRDFSSWGHLVVSVDTTREDENRRINIYWNGELINDYGTRNFPSKDFDLAINYNGTHYIGAYPYNPSTSTYKGYMSNVYFIDGQALGPGYFGFTDPRTNTWRPKKFKAEGTTVNNGTNWSATTGMGSQIFNGGLDSSNASNRFLIYQTDGYLTATTAPITIKKSLSIVTGDGYHWKARLNGSVEVQTGLVNTLTYVASNSFGAVDFDLSNITLPIKVSSLEIAVNSSSGGSTYITGLIVDGVVMVDSTTQNLSYGTNGFYLPMDGNSRIVEDKSGRGNTWNAVNFFDAVSSPDKATGALPILNTFGGAGKIALPSTRTDPYAANLVLALPLVGSNTDVSNQINSGSTTKPVTNQDGSATASTAQSNFYGGSYYFDGNDTLRYDNLSHIGTDDFTVECWLYKTSNNSYERVVTTSISTQSDMNAGFVLGRYVDPGTTYFTCGTASIAASTSIALNKWYHLAGVRKNGVAEFFINGVSQGTAAASTNLTNTDQVYVSGSYNSGSEFLTGYVSDVRVYDGVAKYTSNFVPASPDPDRITFLSNTPSGVSGSSKLTRITDGAVSFDGTNDKLVIAKEGFTTISSSDPFTIEAFVYFNSLTDYSTIIASSPNSTTAGGLKFEIQNSRFKFTADASGSGTFVNINAGPTLSTGKWYHLAASRDGSGNVRTFVDGQIAGTDSTDTGFSITWPNDVTIGTKSDNTEDFNGFISNVRIIDGTALYTSDFTPPTEPLTNVTNTVLLCCQSPTSAGSAAVSPNISGINDGTVWSDKLFATMNGSTSTVVTSLSRAFDGLDSTSANLGPSSELPCQSLTLIHTFTGVTTLQVEGRPDGPHAGDWIISGTGIQTQTVSNQGYGSAVSLTLTSSTVSNLNFTTDNTGAGVHISRIIVNGVTLVDPVLVEDATPSNFNPFTTDINAVKGQEGNYITWNSVTNYGLTLSNGNLDWNGGTTSRYCRPTAFVNSGKWYCEFLMRSTSHIPGIIREDHPNGAGILGELGSSRFQNNGSIGYSGANPVNGGLTWSAGDTVQLFMDMDNKAIYWGVNGIMKVGRDGRSGVPTSGELRIGAVIYAGMPSFTDKISFKSWGPAAGTNGTDTSVDSTVNFGQEPFKYAPPEGYRPFSTATVYPSTSLVTTRPEEYVGVTTYIGTDATRNVNTGLKPDLVWIKNRDFTDENMLFDTVRGPLNRINTSADNTAASQANTLTAFNFDGFTLGSDGQCNRSSERYVSWNWKAGGNLNTFNIDGKGYSNASDVGMSAGALNSSAYDTSQVWSNGLSVNTGSINNAATAFNGIFSINNGASSSVSNGSNDRSMTATLNITLNNEYVEVLPYNTYSGYYATVNGAPQPIKYFTTPDGWQVMGPFTGTLNSVTITNGTETSNRAAGIRGIRVAGKILVDSGATPPNVPTIPSSGSSVGTKQGFSIINYAGTGSGSANSDSGQSFAHGLSQAPDFIMVKNLSTSNATLVYHSAISEHGTMNMRSTATNDTSSFVWAKQRPSQYVVYLGNNPEVNGTGSNYIAYCWHNVPGLQKFGEYTGSGSEGNFVHLGFRPRIILIKNYSGGSISNWSWVDSKRSHSNVANHTLATNLSSAESAFGDGASVFGANNKIDLVSNGFVLREGNAWGNETNVGYIYAAWAEAPTFNLYGGQAISR